MAAWFIPGKILSIVIILVGALWVLLFPQADTDLLLPSTILAWEKMGYYETIFNFDVFYRFTPCRGIKCPTYCLVHGFPSSSFDYADVVDQLAGTGNVLVFDHVGFGFSDKPRDNFTYSIFEHADIAIKLLTKLKIIRFFLIAHDMGDSVVAEILARRFRGLLPVNFAENILGVVFTNGGMQIALSNFRLSQTLLKSPLGHFLNKIIFLIDPNNWFSHMQLRSVWNPQYQNVTKQNNDIQNMHAMLNYKGGRHILHRTIRYLHDRSDFEYRWNTALSTLDIPCLLLWGDSDSVAPLSIALAVNKLAPVCQVQVMPDAGHFVMLEKSDLWVKLIENFCRPYLNN